MVVLTAGCHEDHLWYFLTVLVPEPKPLPVVNSGVCLSQSSAGGVKHSCVEEMLLKHCNMTLLKIFCFIV